MTKLFSWLSRVFAAEVVWVEKDSGQWVKRRRYHPAVKAAALACVLCLAGLAAWAFFLFGVTPEPEAAGVIETADVRSPDVEIPRLRMTDFPDPPGPIPGELQAEPGEYWIRVDKNAYKLYLYRGTDVEKTYEVAVGKNPGDKERSGDNKTPNGIFTVQSIEDSRSWTHDFGDGKGNIRGAYGPWFIRLRTDWRGIGIHGTHDPDSLGSMVSEGCVRMHNAELEELKQFAGINMKVVIEE